MNALALVLWISFRLWWCVLFGRPFGEFPYLWGAGIPVTSLVNAVVQQDVDSTAAMRGLSVPRLQRPRFREGVLFYSRQWESYSVWPGWFSDRYLVQVRSFTSVAFRHWNILWNHICTIDHNTIYHKYINKYYDCSRSIQYHYPIIYTFDHLSLAELATGVFPSHRSTWTSVSFPTAMRDIRSLAVKFTSPCVGPSLRVSVRVTRTAPPARRWWQRTASGTTTASARVKRATSLNLMVYIYCGSLDQNNGY